MLNIVDYTDDKMRYPLYCVLARAVVVICHPELSSFCHPERSRRTNHRYFIAIINLYYFDYQLFVSPDYK